MKTTNDLLVLRSDCYGLDDDSRAAAGARRGAVRRPGQRLQAGRRLRPAVPDGAPCLREGRAASSVAGDWTFGADVAVVGEATLAADGVAGHASSRHARLRLSAGLGSAMALRPPTTRRADGHVDEHVERILGRGRAAAALRPAAARGARAAGVREHQRRRWTCRRSTTRRWTATPCTSPTSPRPPTTDRCTCRWSASWRPGRRKLLAMSPGTAVRIMTGAPVPQGADAVVPVEWTDGGAATVRITRAPRAGQHVRRRGEDVARRRRAARGAARCSARASSGCWPASGGPRCGSRPRPRVVIMSTGAELREPGTQLGHDSIYDANSYMLAAAVRQAGAIAYRVGIVSDDPARVRRRAVRPARPRRPGGDQRRRQQGRVRRRQGGAVADSARSRSARSRCSPASRRASASSARTGRRSSRCRATRSRRTSRSRCSCCRRSAG